MSDRLTLVEQRLSGIPPEKDAVRLWLRLLASTQMIEQELRTMLRDRFNSTMPRFNILAALHRVPDGLTTGELSRWLMVTKGNVTGVAERLSEDGYIKRLPTPTDRRSFVVILTAKGKKEYQRMEQEYEALLREVFADVSLDESDLMTGVLAKLKEAVEERGGASGED